MRNLRLSPGTLGMMQNCERQYEYAKRLLLVNISSDNPKDLDRGSLCHFMLEELYLAIKQDAEVDRVALAEDIIFKATIKRTGLQVADDVWELIQRSFREYVIFYARDWYPVEIERPFAKVLFESEEMDLRIIVEGKIDLVARLADGTHVVVDHKSISRDRIFDKLDNQFACYAWATGLNTVVINKFGLQKSYAPVKKFGRVSLSYTPDNIREWQEQAIVSAVHIAKCIEENYFPMRWAGCSGCSYKLLCKAIPEARDHIMKTQYQINRRFDLFEKD